MITAARRPEEVVGSLAGAISSLGRGADWRRADAIQEVTAPILRALAETHVLAWLLDACAADPRLRDLSERGPWGYQICLLDDPDADMRVRLHTWDEPDQGPHHQPHHHRYGFSSLIVRGRLEHRLYGAIGDVLSRVDGRPIRPTTSRVEAAGAIYTLTPEDVHAIFAEPGSLTLILRGPTVADYQIRFDRTGTWPNERKYGRAFEDEATRAARRTTESYLRELADAIRRFGKSPDAEMGSR